MPDHPPGLEQRVDLGLTRVAEGNREEGTTRVTAWNDGYNRVNKGRADTALDARLRARLAGAKSRLGLDQAR